MISWWKTIFDEQDIQRVTKAICNKNISQGPVTAELESCLAEALDVPYVVATTSGSVSMLMALMALGIQHGDEVIVPNRTWIATAHAVLMLGAKVVLVDVQPDLPLIDISQIENKITNRTKAIMPVHLGGRVVNLRAIREIAKKHGLLVIEDAAQGLFCKHEKAYCGTQSDAGCFSFSISKLIATGQGGFISTQNKETYERLKKIRSHGIDDIINVTYAEMGFNFKFNDILAALGLSQMDRVFKRIDSLNKIYAKYEAALSEFSWVNLIPVNVVQGEIPLYLEVLCKEREQLIDFLASYNVQTRPFYPDLNLAAYLKSTDNFPNARIFGEQGLVLPSGPGQSLEDIDRVIDVLHLFEKEQK